jgi:HAMP domain-containing protein
MVTRILGGHGRIVLLFMIAVLLPGVFLVFSALRMLRQEQELAEKRQADDRRRLARDIGQYLAARLEKIRQDEISAAAARSAAAKYRKYRNAEVVLLSAMAGEELILPWEAAPGNAAAAPPANAGPLARGEGEEFGRHNLPAAAQSYQEALHSARNPWESDSARLALARVLLKLGRHEFPAGLEPFRLIWRDRLARWKSNLLHGLVHRRYCRAQPRNRARQKVDAQRFVG